MRSVNEGVLLILAVQEFVAKHATNAEDGTLLDKERERARLRDRCGDCGYRSTPRRLIRKDVRKQPRKPAPRGPMVKVGRSPEERTEKAARNEAKAAKGQQPKQHKEWWRKKLRKKEKLEAKIEAKEKEKKPEGADLAEEEEAEQDDDDDDDDDDDKAQAIEAQKEREAMEKQAKAEFKAALKANKKKKSGAKAKTKEDNDEREDWQKELDKYQLYSTSEGEDESDDGHVDDDDNDIYGDGNLDSDHDDDDDNTNVEKQSATTKKRKIKGNQAAEKERRRQSKAFAEDREYEIFSRIRILNGSLEVLGQCAALTVKIARDVGPLNIDTIDKLEDLSNEFDVEARAMNKSLFCTDLPYDQQRLPIVNQMLNMSVKSWNSELFASSITLCQEHLPERMHEDVGDHVKVLQYVGPQLEELTREPIPRVVDINTDDEELDEDASEEEGDDDDGGENRNKFDKRDRKRPKRDESTGQSSDDGTADVNDDIGASSDEDEVKTGSGGGKRIDIEKLLDETSSEGAGAAKQNGIAGDESDDPIDRKLIEQLKQFSGDSDDNGASQKKKQGKKKQAQGGGEADEGYGRRRGRGKKKKGAGVAMMQDIDADVDDMLYRGAGLTEGDPGKEWDDDGLFDDSLGSSDDFGTGFGDKAEVKKGDEKAEADEGNPESEGDGKDEADEGDPESEGDGKDEADEGDPESEGLKEISLDAADFYTVGPLGLLAAGGSGLAASAMLRSRRCSAGAAGKNPLLAA